MSTTTAPPACWQTTLFGASSPAIDGLGRLERHHLDDTSWYDLGRDIVHGSDELFAAVHEALPWQSHKRPMYDRIVDVPRLTTFLAADDPRFPPLVATVAALLGTQYAKSFDRVGANLYRDGQDSVAWHGDRVRHKVLNPVIAVVSLGGSRILRLRPRGGGQGRSIPLHSGDMLVMGGACQHDWEHAVPKLARAQPRISLTFRHDHPPDNRFV